FVDRDRTASSSCRSSATTVLPAVSRRRRITGRLFTSRGDTLAYVCEQQGDRLTIWFGEKGSQSYLGQVGDGGNAPSGAWGVAGRRLRRDDDEAPVEAVLHHRLAPLADQTRSERHLGNRDGPNQELEQEEDEGDM